MGREQLPIGPLLGILLCGLHVACVVCVAVVGRIGCTAVENIVT